MKKRNRRIEIKSELQHIAPPDQYKPQKPSELIGPARALGEMLLAHAQKIQRNGSTYKKLLFGQWGNGKSRIASMLGRTLAANPIDIEKINGRNLTIDVVREWQQNCAYGSVFGGWKVKWIEEVDLTPPIAQDLLLTYLDDLPAQTAVIAYAPQIFSFWATSLSAQSQAPISSPNPKQPSPVRPGKIRGTQSLYMVESRILSPCRNPASCNFCNGGARRCVSSSPVNYSTFLENRSAFASGSWFDIPR
jgi:hypothetical protein